MFSFFDSQLNIYCIFVKEMLRPIPAALASCTRFFEAMSAMRESFSTLQKLRVRHSSMSMTPGGSSDGSKYVTPPPQWRDGAMLDSWKQMDDTNAESDGFDGINHRRLSWPSSLKSDQ
jgi:HAUS augmin-like complex subunit 2